MVVVPLPKEMKTPAGAPSTKSADSTNWMRIAAASTLAASGALLITGNRRAGLLAALTGTALVLIDQQDAVCEWWNALPGYLAQIDEVLGRAQAAVEDLSVQGQKLRSVFEK